MKRLVLLSLTAVAACAALAGPERRKMALLVMVDGMRADAVECGAMPNVRALMNGTWESGYRCAWTLDGQIATGSVPSSAPNHVSIATGVAPSKHGVSYNGQTASGNYDQYPTWLKRVVDSDSAKSALFVYSWSEDASLGPADGVEFLCSNNSDAENAVALAARLASSDAPDATMYFIDAPDHAGHQNRFFPMSAAYTNALAQADGYIDTCLDAIRNRSTFANEDWLIIVVSDHGGYSYHHGEITKGRHAHTLPIVIAGRTVFAGHIPGCPYNFDVTATALNHFGIDYSSLDVTRRDRATEILPARKLSDGLAVYLPFDTSATANVAPDATITPTASATAPAITADGKIGSYLNIPFGAYVKLDGTDSLTYEDSNKSFAATIWVRQPDPPQTGDPVIIGNKNWSGQTKGVILFAGQSSQIDYTAGGVYNKPAGVSFNAGNASSNGRIDIGPMDYEGSSDWTFYAVTRNDDGVITLYQGRQDGTLNHLSIPFANFTISSGYPFYIGQDGQGDYKHKFIGGVDDFGLWTRGLTHDEVRKIFEAGRAGTSLGDLVNATSPATATWTGNGANPKDAFAADNWADGAVPTLDTAVTISGTTSFDLASGKALPCASIAFSSVSLADDACWRGIDFAKIASGSSINLNGHALALRATAAPTMTVTDASSGELYLETPSDYANTTLTLSGNLRLVKEGAGKYTQSSTLDAYTGGVGIEEGKFVLAKDCAIPVSVGKGATLDVNGKSTQNSALTLAGGTLTTSASVNINLPASLTQTDDSSIVYPNISGTHDMTVVKDSVWNLGGKTLTLVLDGKDPDFTMVKGATVSNGTFYAYMLDTAVNSSGQPYNGWVHFANLNGRDGLNLDLGNTVLRMKHQEPNGYSKVCDFTCEPYPDRNVYSGNRLEIYGMFTPKSTTGFDMTMMDGSSIDLSDKTGEWACAFANTGGYANGSSTGCCVKFAANSTVTVNLAGRSDLATMAAEGTYVMKWASGGVPSNVTFNGDPTTAAHYKFVLDATGLKLKRLPGLIVFVK